MLYNGQPLFLAGGRPDPLTLLEDDGAVTKLSSFLIRQYADRVEVKNEGDDAGFTCTSTIDRELDAIW